MKKHSISWFEIPTSDIDRAQKFYETIFDMKMSAMDFPQIKMRIFPTEVDKDTISGAIVSTRPGFYNPSETHGPLIYLNGNPNLQEPLDRVVKAGGKILVPKTQVSEDHGYLAVIIDTEGNRIGLHNV